VHTPARGCGTAHDQRRSTLQRRVGNNASMEMNQLMADTLLEEFRQAWAHYRHVENEKNHYVNYFFTVTLGVFCFALALSSAATVPAPSLAVALGTTVANYTCIGASLQVNIRKFDLVVLHYGRAIEIIRSYLYQDVDEDVRRIVETVNIISG